MKIVSNIVGVIALLGGIVFGFMAFIEPSNYSLTTASAPQVTQVYAQAGYYADLAIICILIAIAVILSTSGNEKT